MVNYVRPNPAMMWLSAIIIQLLMAILAVMLVFAVSALSLPMISMWLVVAVLVVLDLVVTLVVALSWLRVRYMIRPGEIIVRKGFLRFDERIYKVDQIKKVEIEQSLWGRLFNYGSLSLNGPGFAEPLELVGVTDPEHFARVIRRDEADNAGTA